MVPDPRVVVLSSRMEMDAWGVHTSAPLGFKTSFRLLWAWEGGGGTVHTVCLGGSSHSSAPVAESSV